MPRETSPISVLSISHRLTTPVHGGGTLRLPWWLVAKATIPEMFAAAQAFISSWLRRLLQLRWATSVFFQITSGIRHA